MGKPHVLVSDYDNSSLKIAPFGSWDQFTAIPGLVNATYPTSISYDPVEAQVYWASIHDGSQRICRCSLNGTDEETLITGLKQSGKFISFVLFCTITIYYRSNGE